MASAGQWYRIDNGDGSVEEVIGAHVRDVAASAFKKPNHAIATCRFRTTWAIYSTGDQLTPEERQCVDDGVREAWEAENHERAKWAEQ